MRDAQLKRAATLGLLTANAAKAEAESLKAELARKAAADAKEIAALRNHVGALLKSADSSVRKDFQKALVELVGITENLAAKKHSHDEFEVMRKAAAGLAPKGHAHPELLEKFEAAAAAERKRNAEELAQVKAVLAATTKRLEAAIADQAKPLPASVPPDLSGLARAEDLAALSERFVMPSIEGDFLVIRDHLGNMKQRYQLKRTGGGGSTKIIQQTLPGGGGGGDQQVFIGPQAPLPYPAVAFVPVTISGQTVYRMQVNVP